jgi:uncharacterized membrane protein (DUF106 family)
MFPSSKLFNRKGKVYRRQETVGLKKKVFMFTILVLVSAAFLYVPFFLVQGQQVGTSISAVSPPSGTAGAQFNVNVQGTIDTANGSFLIFFNSNLVVNGTLVGNSVNANFTVSQLLPGNYSFVLQDVTSGHQATMSYSVVAAGVMSITAVNPDPGTAGAQLSVNVRGTIEISGGSYVVFLNDENVTQGIADGINVNANFTVYSVPPGSYNITLKDVASEHQSDPFSYHVVATGLAAIPIATVLIILVAVAISFANMGLNRLLITKMIGWQEYRSMQKEMSEYNSQRMAALRAKDSKTLERLKKKESQITAMQGKMFKPQLVLIPITFIYLVIWPVLVGVFPFAVAYVPGLGAQPFFIWYLLCSFFFGTIASRVIGVTPIQ